MPFAPHEIEQKKFVVALRGYQTDEVEAFLRAVAADYRAAQEGHTSEALVAEVQQAVAATLKNADGKHEFVRELERLMQTTREQAEHEARELRGRAEAQVAEMRRVATAQL